jgi:hypothetical protein
MVHAVILYCYSRVKATQTSKRGGELDIQDKTTN